MWQMTCGLFTLSLRQAFTALFPGKNKCYCAQKKMPGRFGPGLGWVASIG
jgi:hypothetical protein